LTISSTKRPAPSPEAALATGHLIRDIGRRSRRGGAILLVAQAVRVGGQFITMLVLVRLLPPQAFGLLAMVASLGVMLDLVKEFGLSAATIQRPDISHAQVSALFWINAAVGFLLAAALFVAAPALATFYGQPDLETVARWLALGFVMSGLTVQHWALLRRQMRFTAIAGLETGADLAAFAVVIALALSGAGYWALVAQRLIMPGLLLAGSWAICRWRPARPALAPGLPDLLRYGGSITASGVSAALARSVDQILIGWLWGPGVLGLYERTTRLVLLPVNNINAPVYAAGMPALSRLVDQPVRYRSMFRQIIQKLALLTVPVFALTAVLADWAVYILFGPAWLEATPLVAMFSVTAAYLPVLLTAGLLYMTQGRTGEMVRATLIDGALCVGAIVAGLPWGVVGVSASIALVGVLARLPIGFWLASRHGPVSFGDMLDAIAPATCAGAAGAAMGFVLHRYVFPAIEPTPIAVLVVAAATGTIMLLTALTWPEVRREAVQLARLVMRPRGLRGQPVGPQP
jgi:PST family polysaccharide transporter